MRVDYDLLHPADVVERGRQGLRWPAGWSRKLGGGLASQTLSVPLPVMRLRQGVVRLRDMAGPFAFLRRGCRRRGRPPRGPALN